MTTLTDIILHLGFHRTATTALQRHLRRCHDELLKTGILYRDRRLYKGDPLQCSISALGRQRFFPQRHYRAFKEGLEAIRAQQPHVHALLISNETLIGPMPSAKDQRLYPRAGRLATRLKTLERLLEEQYDIRLRVRIRPRDENQWRRSVYRFRLGKDLMADEATFMNQLSGSLDASIEQFHKAGLNDLALLPYRESRNNARTDKDRHTEQAALEAFLQLPSETLRGMEVRNFSMRPYGTLIWQRLSEAGYPIQEEPLRSTLLKRLNLREEAGWDEINTLLQGHGFAPFHD